MAKRPIKTTAITAQRRQKQRPYCLSTIHSIVIIQQILLRSINPHTVIYHPTASQLEKRKIQTPLAKQTKNIRSKAMGSASSQPQKRTLTKAQQDIKHLGDRMPFGDAELYEVYKAYFARIKLHRQQQEEKQEQDNQEEDSTRRSLVVDSSSFLTEMGMLIYNENPEVKNDETDERLILLQAMESKILSPHFGSQLYRTAFLTKSKEEPREDDDDEYTRMSKLEAFFDGLANSTRRGLPKSLKVCINCCEHQHLIAANNDEAVTAANGGYNNDFAYNAGGGGGYYAPSSSSTEKTYEIEPLELITIGYRVALGAAFLQSNSPIKNKKRDDNDGAESISHDEGLEEEEDEDDDEHQDISRFFPPDDETIHKDSGLLALANSLSEFARKRQQRIGRHNDFSTSKSSQEEQQTQKLYVSEEDIQEWAEHVSPLFSAGLASLLHEVFFPFRPYPPTRSNFEYPNLTSFESSIFLEGNSSLLFSLACMSPALTGEYYRLYTAASDGLSFNRLQNALLGYGGPTLVIIQSEDSIFGAFTGSSWKESKDFYGNTDCFLFQLQPKTAVYRPTGKDTKFMYCNSFARSRGYDKQAHGIGFGGTVDKPRLFLPESFDDCWAGSQDLTFENGILLATKHTSNFVIDNLEVWGVGGTDIVNEALGARRRQRDIRQANINKARKVDKAAFLDDFRSGVIESKAFAHREQIRGRADACIDDQDLNNYKYPKN